MRQRLPRPTPRDLLTAARRPRSLSVLTSLLPVLSNLGMTPVLTRALGPERYGLWALSIGLLGLLPLLDLGIGTSLYRFMTVANHESGPRLMGRYLNSA